MQINQLKDEVAQVNGHMLLREMSRNWEVGKKRRLSLV